MIRVYVAAAFAALFMFAYWAGMQIGRTKCAADSASAVINTNSEIINKVNEVRNETIKTDTGDIRRILHEKYTIAD